jgi:LytS/YehU family sensor histidine kinase
MATKKTTKIAEVLIEDEDEVVEAPAPAPAPEPTIVAPTTKNAKIKGTWTMFYGTTRWDFVDGHRYDLPLDLFEYLKKAGNIYDTL